MMLFQPILHWRRNRFAIVHLEAFQHVLEVLLLAYASNQFSNPDQSKEINPNFPAVSHLKLISQAAFHRFHKLQRRTNNHDIIDVRFLCQTSTRTGTGHVCFFQVLASSAQNYEAARSKLAMLVSAHMPHNPYTFADDTPDFHRLHTLLIGP